MVVKVSKPEIDIREKINELDKPSGIAGEAMLRTRTIAEQAALLGFQPNNIFINGDQRIWQRGATRTGIGSAVETDMSDRWVNYQYGTSGRCTWSQDTDAPDGHEYSAKIQVTTADTSVAANHRWNIAYRMETDDFRQMGFGTQQAIGFTVQFWVKSNKVGTYSFDAYINNSKPTFKRNFTVDSSGVWKKVVLTFPPSMIAAGANPSFWLWLQAGSDYTDDRGEVWTGTTDGRAHGQTVNLYDSTSNFFMITGIQMIRGEYPTGLPFHRRSMGEELMLCQRYFQIVACATGTPGFTGRNWQGLNVNQFNTSRMFTRIFFPTQMRTTPTVTVENPNFAFAYNNLSRTLSTVPNNIYADMLGVGLDFHNQGTNFTPGQTGHVDLGGSCKIVATAEL